MRRPSRLIALALLLLACAALLRWRGCVPGFVSEELSVEAGAVPLAGSLRLPRGAGPWPGLVLVPGAGPARRGDPWSRAHAERLCAAGFAVLSYDKRGSQDSGWRVGHPLRVLARDVRAALAALRADGRVDPRRVGLVALSQGGAVALLALQEEPEVAGLVAVSFSPHSPAEQVTATLAHRLLEAGFDDATRARAGELARRAVVAARRGEGVDGVRAELAREEHRAWLDAARVPLLCDPDLDWDAFRALPMDLDPLAALADCRAPVLIVQGEEDDLVPGAWAAASLEELARREGLDVEVRSFDGAGHGLRVRDGVRLDWERGWLAEDWSWPEAYWSALTGWLRTHVASG